MGATEQDKKLKQYLEDERIALFLQNEEFMRELQRNREFLVALERGMTVSARPTVHRHSAMRLVSICLVIWWYDMYRDINHRK